jgi:hypothetical protein
LESIRRGGLHRVVCGRDGVHGHAVRRANGWTFDGIGGDAGAFTYDGAVVTNPVGAGTIIVVTIAFPATGKVVTDRILTDYVPKPVVGESPTA